MLPDLWRMADGRVRPAKGVAAPEEDAALREVLAGIEHHLEVDRWFHAAPVFVDGERATRSRIREAGVEAPKIGLFAHVIWEMLLDGALVRREGLEATLESLRIGFEDARDASAMAASAHHFDRLEADRIERRSRFDQRMSRIVFELERGPWIEGYRRGPGVADRTEGVRSRLGLGPFDDRDRDRLIVALDGLESLANEALATLK